MADASKVLIYDSRLVQRAPMYAIRRGAISVNVQPNMSITASATSQTFNINTPYEGVIWDRYIPWQCTTYLQFNVTSTANGGALPLIGRDFALAPFPNNQLISTIQITLNDCAVSIQQSDIFEQLLRATALKENDSIRTSPYMLDRYANYNSAFQTLSNPLAAYNLALDSSSVPNGAWPAWFTDPAGNALSGIGGGTGTYTVGTGPGAITVQFTNGIPTNIAGGGIVAGTAYPIFLAYTTTEPLFCSPFIFSDTHEHDTGLFGIQTASVVMNFRDPGSARLIRQNNLNGWTVSSVAYRGTAPFANSGLYITYLSPPPQLPRAPASVVPYLEAPRYITSGLGILRQQQTTLNVQTSTVTFPQIPDIIGFSVVPPAYGAQEANWLFPIYGITITFANRGGLMSTFILPQLFKIARTNGLYDVDYNMYSGLVRSFGGGPVVASTSLTQSVGSPLFIKPEDWGLDDVLAPGVNGQWSFQAALNIFNPSSADVTGAQIVLVTYQSGFFVTRPGTSKIIKAPLSEKDVADIKAQPDAMVLLNHEVDRMVGGSLWSKLASGVGKALQFYRNYAKPALHAVHAGVSALPGARAAQIATALGKVQNVGDRVHSVAERFAGSGPAAPRSPIRLGLASRRHTHR